MASECYCLFNSSVCLSIQYFSNIFLWHFSLPLFSYKNTWRCNFSWLSNQMLSHPPWKLLKDVQSCTNVDLKSSTSNTVKFHIIPKWTPNRLLCKIGCKFTVLIWLWNSEIALPPSPLNKSYEKIISRECFKSKHCSTPFTPPQFPSLPSVCCHDVFYLLNLTWFSYIWAKKIDNELNDETNENKYLQFVSNSRLKENRH